MLKEITWNQYWTIVITLTALYELFIVFIFYRKDLLLLAKRKRDFVSPAAPASSNQNIVADTEVIRSPVFENQNIEEEELDEEELEEINLTPYAHELADEIHVLIEQAAEKEYAKPELLFGLKQIIKGFHDLKDTSYQRDINNLIIQECAMKCSIHLDAGEIATLWLSEE